MYFVLTFAVAGNSLSTSATNYVGFANVGANEATIVSLLPGITPTEFACNLTGAPDNGGGTQSYTMTLRSAGADRDWTCAISEASTDCTADTSGSAVAAGLYSISTVPAGTPTARAVRCYVRYYIP